MEFAGTQKEIESLKGQPVFAANGEKVGDIDKVFYDKATRIPEWIALDVGLLGLKSRLAPLRGAERRADGVVLRHSVTQIKDAPELEGDEVSQDLERRLASHYGLQYSESRSPTGLASGREGSARQSKRPAKGSARRTARQRRSTGRVSRRSEERTRDELYEEAKRRDVPGRSKMTKAQLERALGRSGRQSRSRGRAAKANPFEVQGFLEAVGYPASKRQLVNEAKEQGADARVRSTLERLPDEEFGTAADVSKAIARLS
jgi:hypothetical protein